MAMRADIAAPQRVRGRPKGTGINDRDQVVRLQEMLDADPSLKPTTAIKQLGVTDPSVIRRLRDKLTIPQTAETKPLPKPTAKPLAIPTPVAREKKPPAPKPVTKPAETIPATPPQPAPAINTAEQKAREAALLAAYLQAMQQSQARSVEAKPEPKPEPPKPEPSKSQPQPFPFASMMPPGFPGFPGMPSFPGMPPMGMPGMPANPMQAFSIPGFPSFLQPFQQKPAAPQAGTDQARQLEAMKLAIEATTAIARFQLHLVENAAAYSPMAMMLQGQSFIGQMMIAGLTGQLGALQRQMTNPKPSEKK